MVSRNLILNKIKFKDFPSRPGKGNEEVVHGNVLQPAQQHSIRMLASRLCHVVDIYYARPSISCQSTPSLILTGYLALFHASLDVSNTLPNYSAEPQPSPYWHLYNDALTEGEFGLSIYFFNICVHKC